MIYNNISPSQFDLSLTGPVVKVRLHQGHWAALQIQRVWRSYSCREKLWSFTGYLTQTRVLRIQRLWRGYVGRKVALQMYYLKLYNAATKIKIAFLRMKARAFLRSLRADRLHRSISTLQRLWRVRVAVRRYKEMLRIRKFVMSRRIQSFTRGYLGRRRVRGILVRRKKVIARLESGVSLDYQIRRRTFRYLSGKLSEGDRDTTAMNEWELFELALTTLLSMDRPSIALSLCESLTLRRPRFILGWLLLSAVRYYSWPAVGKKRLPHEHLLEEALSMPDRLPCMAWPLHRPSLSIDKNAQRFPSPSLLRTPSGCAEYLGGCERLPPQLAEADPVSLFADIIQEIQVVYFSAALQHFNRNVRTLSALGCWLGSLSSREYAMRENVRIAGTSSPSPLKSGRSETWRHARSQEKDAVAVCGAKARKLLQQAMISAPRLEKGDCVRRLEVAECLFDRESQLLGEKDVVFTDTTWRAAMLKEPNRGILLRTVSSTLSGEHHTAASESEFRRSKMNVTPVSIQGEVPREVAYYSHIDEEPLESVEENSTLPQVSAPDDDSSRRMNLKMRGRAKVYRCGEMLVLSGVVLNQYSLTAGERGSRGISSMKRSQSTRDHFSMTHISPTQSSLDFARDLTCFCASVFLPNEVERLYETSVTALARARGESVDKVLKLGKWACVAEFLLQSVRAISYSGGRVSYSSDLNRSTELYTHGSWINEWDEKFLMNRKYRRCYKLIVPLASLLRIQRDSIATEDYSVRMIQRAYRGSKSRFLFKRLALRAEQRARQLQESLQQRSQLAAVRELRRKLIVLIQSIIRRFLIRSRVFHWTVAAVIIQKYFRRFSAIQFIIAEKRRRSLGPDVFEMFRGGMRISGVAMTLVVKRCGGQYLLEGYDLLQNMKYVGVVLSQEVDQLLSIHNKSVETLQTGSTIFNASQQKKARMSEAATKKNTLSSSDISFVQSPYLQQMPSLSQPIYAWDHRRVTELLVSQIALTATISSTTAELGAGKRDHQCALIILKTATGFGIEHINSLRRVLSDQQHIIDRYNKLASLHNTSRNGDPLGFSKGLFTKYI